MNFRIKFVLVSLGVLSAASARADGVDLNDDPWPAIHFCATCDDEVSGEARLSGRMAPDGESKFKATFEGKDGSTLTVTSVSVSKVDLSSALFLRAAGRAVVAEAVSVDSETCPFTLEVPVFDGDLLSLVYSSPARLTLAPPCDHHLFADIGVVGPVVVLGKLP